MNIRDDIFHAPMLMDGRIDAVWNDTRGSADRTVSALYYASSYDGGVSWSPNEQASPTWNSMIGWPLPRSFFDK